MHIGANIVGAMYHSMRRRGLSSRSTEQGVNQKNGEFLFSIKQRRVVWESLR